MTPNPISDRLADEARVVRRLARAGHLEDEARERLELHQRMAAALRGLPEPYRTVVLRVPGTGSSTTP